MAMAAARPFGPDPTTTASGTRCEVPVEPLRRAAQRVDHVLARPEPVTLARVDVLLERLAALTERVDHLLRLRARHAWIVRALQQEQRRFDLCDVRERRPLAIEIRDLRRVTELALEVVPQVAACGVVERLPRDDTNDRYPRSP